MLSWNIFYLFCHFNPTKLQETAKKKYFFGNCPTCNDFRCYRNSRSLYNVYPSVYVIYNQDWIEKSLQRWRIGVFHRMKYLLRLELTDKLTWLMGISDIYARHFSQAFFSQWLRGSEFGNKSTFYLLLLQLIQI